MILPVCGSTIAILDALVWHRGDTHRNAEGDRGGRQGVSRGRSATAQAADTLEVPSNRLPSALHRQRQRLPARTTARSPLPSLQFHGHHVCAVPSQVNERTA